MDKDTYISEVMKFISLPQDVVGIVTLQLFSEYMSYGPAALLQSGARSWVEEFVSTAKSNHAYILQRQEEIHALQNDIETYKEKVTNMAFLFIRGETLLITIASYYPSLIACYEEMEKVAIELHQDRDSWEDMVRRTLELHKKIKEISNEIWQRYCDYCSPADIS